MTTECTGARIPGDCLPTEVIGCTLMVESTPTTQFIIIRPQMFRQV